jgi:hypothetical protein
MTDWHALATEDNQQRFADAQARLDEGDYPPGEAGEAQRAEDKRFADWYDANVNAAAQDEHERQGEEEEFRRHFPEPVDGSRFEWEDREGVVHGAYRQDFPPSVGDWWVYGDVDSPYSWRRLVAEHNLHMDDLTFLVPAEDGTL